MFKWIRPGVVAKINPLLFDSVKFPNADVEGFTPEMRFSVVGIINEKRDYHDYSPVVVRCLDDGELYVMPACQLMPENGWS